MKKVPIIDITDLYHPAQDPGDNFDIITAYALPEIDLRAVILDATDKFRHPYADDTNPMFRDMRGIARDPGYVPMTQMNCLFDRHVPFASGPLQPMTSPQDKLEQAPLFQQGGVELILRTLRESDEPVHILSFGSARTLAAAFNREPELLKEKVELIHLSAGASSSSFLEWNVLLDPQAIVCLLRSGLPIAIYPCATANGPFAYGPHNSFWKLQDLAFIRDMHPRLRRYLGFAFGHVQRMDFLRALESDLPDELMEEVYRMDHNVWETAIWAQVSGRRLVEHDNGTYRLIPATDVLPTDRVLPNELKPCSVLVHDDGSFTFELTQEHTNLWIYDRGDAELNEIALREALPALYQSFAP